MTEELPAIKTPLTPTQAAITFRNAWKAYWGAYPQNNSLCLLLAHSAEETGWFKSSYCYNFTNIKTSINNGIYDYTHYRCSEIINGKEIFYDPPNPITCFRAFKTADDGAVAYIKFLAERSGYDKVWKAIDNADPADFAHQLKLVGFYTADEALYTKNVVSLFNSFMSKIDAMLAGQETQAEDFSEINNDVQISINQNLDDSERKDPFS